MAVSQVASGDRIIDPMIALSGCSMQNRIIVAGSKSTELMIELHRRGYLRAAATANCGRPIGQYEVALVNWRRRTPQKPAANQSLRSSLEKRGFVIEQTTVHECGCTLAARRRQTIPLNTAA